MGRFEDYQKALDFLFDEAAQEYEIDEDNGELIINDCTNQDKYIIPANLLQELVDKERLKPVGMTIINDDFEIIQTSNNHIWLNDYMNGIKMHIQGNRKMKEQDLILLGYGALKINQTVYESYKKLLECF